MLNKLTLHNFRRHRELTMEFSPGIQCLRGANEYGKTSTLEAIAYALFGSKVLRTSLDDCVTWGEPVNTLKVELTLHSQGEVFTFKRGKSGAEVIKNGKVFCTGQTEVSSFAASLLGADATTAAKLLMANQNGIRGALEEGPKALSSLIEDLAGFSTFDEILEAAQAKLALGSPALLEERLKGAEETRSAAMDGLPPKPDAKAHEGEMQALKKKVEKLEATLTDLNTKAKAAETRWQELGGLYYQRSQMEAKVEQAKTKLADAKAQANLYVEGAAKVVDAALVPSLKSNIVEAEDFDKRAVAYRVFAALPEIDRFPGTEQAFEARLDEVKVSSRELTMSVNETEKAITAAKYRRIDHDKCDKCGQDITHLDHVKETNASVDAELVLLLPKLEAVKARLELVGASETNLLKFSKAAREISQHLSKLTNFCEIDTSTYPATVTWQGSVPGEGLDVVELKRQLVAAEAEVRAVEQAKAKLEMAEGMVAAAQIEVDATSKALAEFAAPTADEVVAATEAKDAALVKFDVTNGEIYLINNEIEVKTRDFITATKLWSMAQGRVTDAEKVVEACRKDLGSLAFNNSLVKRLRVIRPMVSDRLWATVLSSVSVMFSQIRGEESWVSKGKDGFRVNGQAVESLSGSTLDSLGLALRVALMKTFIPQADLLILDEVAAGMDAGRTERMLGFIAGSQIGQVLLVTHDTVSSAVSDNLIEL